MKPCFEHMTLFTTALCNLNCKYCYICKDSAGGLDLIDKDIAEDFENGRQIQQVLDFDPSIKDTLKGVILWGGEPFLHVERFVDNMEDFFTAFPNLNRIDTSTNFTIPNQAFIVENMLNKIDKLYHGEEKFIFSMQISIDGYPEMNDAGRGAGVTEKFLKNFQDLCSIRYNSDKIDMEVFPKPTLAKETFKYLLNKDDCIKWFEFFDKEMAKVHDLSGAAWKYRNALFNCAAPTEWTKEDGIQYSQISRNLQEIREEVAKSCPSWRLNLTLVPEANLAAAGLADVKFNMDSCLKRLRGHRCGGGCGSFIYNIVPITKGKFTMCHRGVFDAYTDYFNNLTSKESMNGLSSAYFKADNILDWIYTPEEFKKINNSFKKLDEGCHQIFYTDLIYDIKEYAHAGIIDERYKEISNIEPTLGYFLENSLCLQDAYLFTGSWLSRCPNEIPLLYNGTMAVVQEELDRILEERGTNYDLSRAIR